MYGLIKQGKVRTVLVGDVMRVRVSDLEIYLAKSGKIGRFSLPLLVSLCETSLLEGKSNDMG